ncbi:MAG: hypothetical protein HY319_22765 [Armatimonadetes bacterium]|nr:hypothetical protein [Armatimonadota bacterium]
MGVGGISTMAEFLSPEHDQSWRERVDTNFLGEDLLALYRQGTYTSSL